MAVAVAVAVAAVGDPAAHTTTHRAGRPEVVAPVILFLVRAGSSFVTGSEPVIDGGLTAH
ncbi:SDR family oxidoreductase [Streptomyces griseoaurantiacus]|uniref:SDR family oxidoreductase n=1 Tax=Streptomyces griseoaurantiacus TaxID=68213 RepID=UPI00387E8115